MSQYRLRWGDGVKSAVRALPGNVRHRVERTIRGLLDDPYPAEAIEMRPPLGDHWRIQIDDWRIVYTVDEDVFIVEIVKVGRKSGPDRGSNFYNDLRLQS
jgi:mRNA interferase RelE/StbE